MVWTRLGGWWFTLLLGFKLNLLSARLAQAVSPGKKLIVPKDPVFFFFLFGTCPLTQVAK